jgi:hypothetical protein
MEVGKGVGEECTQYYEIQQTTELASNLSKKTGFST